MAQQTTQAENVVKAAEAAEQEGYRPSREGRNKAVRHLVDSDNQKALRILQMFRDKGTVRQMQKAGELPGHLRHILTDVQQAAQQVIELIERLDQNHATEEISVTFEGGQKEVWKVRDVIADLLKSRESEADRIKALRKARSIT